MSWKLPLNQVGSGTTFIVGRYTNEPRFRATSLSLQQHPWLVDILREIDCSIEGPEANFALAVDVEKQSDAYRVTAHLSMTPGLECVRSLTPFRTTIETENEALYVRGQPTASMTGEHELSESEMESYEHDGQVLMLSEFVTDVIFTSLPDFPLCRADCKGLCSECGCNLNDAKSCGRAHNPNDADLNCPHIQYFQ